MHTRYVSDLIPALTLAEAEFSNKIISAFFQATESEVSPTAMESLLLSAHMDQPSHPHDPHPLRLRHQSNPFKSAS